MERFDEKAMVFVEGERSLGVSFEKLIRMRLVIRCCGDDEVSD